MKDVRYGTKIYGEEFGKYFKLAIHGEEFAIVHADATGAYAVKLFDKVENGKVPLYKINNSFGLTYVASNDLEYWHLRNGDCLAYVEVE